MTTSTVPTRAREFALRSGADVFAPKGLIELARPSAGTPNAEGTLVFNTVSQYSFETKKNEKTLVVTSLASKAQAKYPLEKGGELFWLDGQTLGHVYSTADHESSLYALSLKVETESALSFDATPDPPTLIGTFPSSTSGNFIYNPSSRTLVFSDKVYADGNLTAIAEGDKAWDERGNSAFVYDEGFERHWDHYVGPKKNSLFAVSLEKKGEKWAFGEEFKNLLKGTGHSTPVEPFGGSEDFTVSKTHVVYTAKDPVLPEAWHTRQNVYIVPLEGGEPRELTSGKQGATHNPVFDASGTKVAWLELEKDGHESDRSRVVIYDLEKDVRYTLTQPWDRSPDGLSFAPDAPILYLTAGDHAQAKIFALPLPPTPEQSSTSPPLPPRYTHPRALTSGGAAHAAFALPGGRVLYSRSSLTGPDDIFVLEGLEGLHDALVDEKEDPRKSVDEEGAHLVSPNLATLVKPTQLTSFTADALSSKNLSKPEHFYFTGHEGKRIHGYALKPRGWREASAKEGKTWPVVMLIHGGPEGVWDERWSTRWNPNVFAQQGYFVVVFNPAGSTTFGQELTDAIQEHWGSRPFTDMQAGWTHALSLYPSIDPTRAVAAGASWGGYAINWIQGHQSQYDFNFKALFCHDGVFDATYNGFSTDELYFFQQEWGGRPWDEKAKAILKEFNAREFVGEWRTPMLIVHGSKDFRLAETEGIAAYHALKQQGIPARLVIFPDENHWVLNHGNSLKWHYEVFRWFDTYVGTDDDASDVEVAKVYD
ncbi:unnamed protein product [Peniophora sp. CBMAI 1063]|nr:unnamed protein product [Peniophora sp. CBMAI 1063]